MPEITAETRTRPRHSMETITHSAIGEANIAQRNSIHGMELDHGPASLVAVVDGTYVTGKVHVRFEDGQERVINPNGTWLLP